MDFKKNTPAKLVIRTITDTDIEGYRDVLDSVAREKKFLSFFEAPALKDTYDFVNQNIVDNWPHLIALVDEKIVGWCDISSLDRPIFNHSGVLGIGLLAKFRGLGIGEKLVNNAIDQAQKKGLTRIELTVRESNHSAIALYKKLGFKVEGLHLKAVRVDDIYDNHVSMALLF
ncbi:MAG: GNAT family N-acetyltransferase [Legionella sp.]|nr:GNAT family N-acetyltransferase [Legionella sp.]